MSYYDRIRSKFLNKFQIYYLTPPVKRSYNFGTRFPPLCQTDTTTNTGHTLTGWIILRNKKILLNLNYIVNLDYNIILFHFDFQIFNV